MIERWRVWHLRPDPLGFPRHGLVVFMLALCVTSGLATVVGEPAANSIEATLPEATTLVWGGMLLVGGLGALVGMFWQGDPRTGLVAKRFGYTSLCLASLIYAPILLVSAGIPGGALAGGTVLGFALACAHTAWRVDRRIAAILEAGELPEGVGDDLG
jgi:hypothetical protein